MATSTLLKNIHVFPTLASYESNKASIGENELALINSQSKFLPISFENMTLISTNTPLGNGTITLNQPYTNFDGLFIQYSNDSRQAHNSVFVSIWDFQNRIKMAQSLNKTIVALFDLRNFWYININTSTTTSLVHNDDDCYIEAIYGVNI